MEERATAWLTVREAARLVGVDGDTVRRWADGGRVRHMRTVGGHRRVDRESLLTAVEPARERTGGWFGSPLDAVRALESEADGWVGWSVPRSVRDEELAAVVALIGADGRRGGLVASLEELASVLSDELASRDRRALEDEVG